MTDSPAFYKALLSYLLSLFRHCCVQINEVICSMFNGHKNKVGTGRGSFWDQTHLCLLGWWPGDHKCKRGQYSLPLTIALWFYVQNNAAEIEKV